MSETLNINSGNIEQVINDGVTPEEAKAILKRLKKIITPLSENLEEIKINLEGITSEKKEMKQKVGAELKSLLVSVETSNKSESNIEFSENASFNELKEVLSTRNEIIAKLFNISNLYFNNKLDSIGITGAEKENVKLVLWDKLMQNLDVNLALGTITTQIKGKVESLFTIFKTKNTTGEKNEQENQITATINGLTEIEAVFKTNSAESSNPNPIFTTFDTLMGDSFSKLETAQKNKKEMKTVQQISSIIEGEKSTKTFDEIKNNTFEKLKTFEKADSTTNNIKDILEKLPEKWQKDIKEFLKDLSENYPFLGFIIMLFFGNSYLEGNDSEKKARQSLNSLAGLVEKAKKNDSIKNLGVKKLTELDPKKLENFFEYLDSKEIDYTTETFWKDLISGISENEKLSRLSVILKGDSEIIGEKGENTTEYFIKKLNNIKGLEKELLKKEETATVDTNKKIISDFLALEAQAKESTRTDTSETQSALKEAQKKAESAKQGNEEISQRNEFENSVRAIPSLNTTIRYKGEDVELSVEDDKVLVLGEKKYKISINTFIGDIFQSITFKDGKVQITHTGGVKNIETDDLIKVLSTLLEEKDYSKRFKKEGATLKIEKID